MSSYIFEIKDYEEHGQIVVRRNDRFSVIHAHELAKDGDAIRYIKNRFLNSDSASLSVYTSQRDKSPMLHICKTTHPEAPYCVISSGPGKKTAYITFDEVLEGLAALAANMAEST